MPQEIIPPKQPRPDFIPDSQRHLYPWMNGAGKQQDFVPAGKTPEVVAPEEPKKKSR